MGVRLFERLWIIALCACFVGLAVPARAQLTTASVVGTVTDTTGAVIPGATVTITNTGTNIKQTASANAAGDYVFNLLIPGTYTLQVSSAGFKTYVVPDFALAAGDQKREDAKLQVGAVTQTVQVQATTPALQTQTASISTLVTSEAVENLPLNGRNITSLVQLAAGVNAGSPDDLMSGARPDDRRPTATYSANGANDYANDSMVDGFDNNAPIGTNIVRPSVDAIQQVVVETNDYSAQLTRVAGAGVNIITKSGTNSFHGSLYEFFRNSALDANPNYSFPAGYTAAGTPLFTNVPPKGAFRQNQYGGSIGGPVLKNKTFFFGDFEQFRKAQAFGITDTVPTLCNRGMAACPDGKTQLGDFSDQPDISTYGGSKTPCTPNTTVVAVGSCPYVDVPASSITPLGLAYFNMYPLPTSPGLTGNYSHNIAFTQNYTTWDARVDQHFNDKNTFFGRYSFNDTTTVTPDDFPVVHIDPATGNLSSSGLAINPGVFTNGVRNNYPGTAKERSQGLAMSWAHVFSPDFLVDLKAGWVRWANNSLQGNAGTPDLATKLGFPCNSVSCVNIPGTLMAAGIPKIGVAGFAQAMGDSIFLPIIYYDNTFQYMGDFTLTKGKHEFLWGASLIRRNITFAQSSDGQGSFGFLGSYTGQPLADLLEGLAAGGTTFYCGGCGNRSMALDQQNSRDWEWGFYVQDNYRATSRLTLNLGMRYDIYTAPTERHGRFSNWDPATGLLVSPSIPGAQQSSASGNVRNNYLDFSPRIGFADSITPTLVVRGGFGITFCPLCGHLYDVGNLPNQSPFTYVSNCKPQNEAGTNTPCQAPFANGQIVEYGPPPTVKSSTVGQTGGSLLSAGVPVPVLNITQVLAPASCPPTALPTSFGCTLAGGNGYANLGSLGRGMPYMPTPYIEQFSLEVQKDFGGNVVSVGYVGELGRHQEFSYNLNAIANGVIPADENPPLAFQAGYPWLRFNNINEQYNEATTSYHALQTSFIRRFKAGLTFDINYVWSHNMADGQGNCNAVVAPANLGYGNGPKYIDPCYFDNLKNPSSPIVSNAITNGVGQVGNSFLDYPNRIAGTIEYQLPFGKSMTGFEGQALKGWSVNAAGFWQSGLPFSVNNGVGVPGVGGGVDQVCSGNAAHPTILDWLNEACFVDPTANTYGVQDFFQNRGPRQRSVDFSLYKNFTLTERVSMQFRTEVFNLLNLVNFLPPGNNPGNNGSVVNIPAFSNGNSAGGVGLAQSVATQNKAGALGELNPNIQAREIQFALKFLF